MAKIVIEIKCGDETCQKQASGICQFHNGKDSHCELFKKHLEHIYDGDSAYPLSQRLPECLKAQVPETTDPQAIKLLQEYLKTQGGEPLNEEEISKLSGYITANEKQKEKVDGN